MNRGLSDSKAHDLKLYTVLLSKQLQTLSSKGLNTVSTWHWAALLEYCLKAFRWIWEIKEFQHCLESKTIHKETMFVSVSQKCDISLKVMICWCSLPKVTPYMFEKPLTAATVFFPLLSKYFQWLMWTTESKKLLARIQKLHVDRIISNRHLAGILLSAVKTWDNEGCSKEAASGLVYFLLGTSFPVLFRHTKRLNV